MTFHGNGHRNGTHDAHARAISVLMYHRIVDNAQLARRHWTCLHIDTLRRHLRLLDRWGFTTITFADYRLYLAGELTLPRKPIVLTFDDGFLDLYTLAYPLLQEMGMKAVGFVVASRNLKTNLWDRSLGLPEAPLLEPHQIAQMSNNGIEIGSHTLSHARLTELPEDQAWREIAHSKMVLEMLIGSSVESISYPYGLVNGRVKSIARDVGYTVGCSVHSGPATFGEDPFEIRRIAIKSGTGTCGFGLRLLPPYPRYEFLRWRAAQSIRGTKTNGYAHSSSRVPEAAIPANGGTHGS